MNSKKVPPYSKNLRGLLLSGKRPQDAVWLYIGDHAWESARDREIDHPLTTLALPPWYCPSRYSWPVKGCAVLIVDTGFADAGYIHDTIGSLFRDGAVIVHSCGRDLPFTTHKRTCPNDR